MLSITKIFSLLFGIVYLISGITINFVQFLLYILLRPIRPSIYRKINYYLSYSLYSQIVFLEQYWANIKVTMHSRKGHYDMYYGKEHALLIMNHSYEIDWMIGWILCDGCCILGNVKTFAKKSLQYLPTLGYSWRLGGSIFVERDWRKDQSVFENKLMNLISYAEPIWLLLAAEGTRFTKEKHEASLVFARERGLPELRHHLTPRTRGFTTSIPIVRKKIHAIYNVNIGIRPGGVKPTLTNILRGKQILADFFVERYPMDDIPESKEDLANWLHNLYKRKDDLLHRYLTTGKWQEVADPEEYETFYLPRRIFPAVNFFVWSVVVLIPLGSFLFGLLTSGSVYQFASAVILIGSFIVLLDKLVSETKISKASTYGMGKT